MKNIYKILFLSIVFPLVLLSCDDLIYEDITPCKEGVSLRFIYDYNMEYIDKFPQEVDCIKLLVYDSEGNFITSKEDSLINTTSEGYLLTLDLPAKDYYLIAYGGISCEKASFKIVADHEEGSKIEDLKTSVNSSLELTSANVLHNFYYGASQVSVIEDSQDYALQTIYMKKNCNYISIALTGEDISDDYDVSILIDDGLFDYQNNLLENAQITYLPFNKETYFTPDDYLNKQNSFLFEFSLSKLEALRNAQLIVTSKTQNIRVIDINIIDLLEALRNAQFSWLTLEEYLEREDSWTLEFPLVKEDNMDRWLGTSIIINSWVLRINNIPL